jgi:hypothetical protein
VKEVAKEVGVSVGHNALQSDRHPAVRNAVLWCVKRYYDPHWEGP